jgi:hypothetical protein
MFLWMLSRKTLLLSVKNFLFFTFKDPTIRMNEGIIKERVSKVLRKWTVLRLLEGYIDNIKLEEPVSQYLFLIDQSKEDRNGYITELGESIHTYLERMEVDVEIESCERMASILIDVYLEALSGKSEIFNSINSREGCDVQKYSSSDESDVTEE